MNGRYKISIILLVISSLLSVQLAAAMRDPTRPPGYENKVQRELAVAYKLTSTLVSAERRIALLNEQLVEIGDTVDGAAVMRIKVNSVLLKKGGQLFTVHLFKEQLGIIALEVAKPVDKPTRERGIIRVKAPWKK